MKYAGFWIRLGAFIVDYLTISIFIIPLGVWASLSTPGLRAGAYLAMAPLIFAGLFLVISFLYFTLFWAWRGQTLGKILIGAKVVQTNGEALTFGRSVLRYLGFVICFLTLYIGFITIAFHSQKRGLHDIIANTCVIKTKNPHR